MQYMTPQKGDSRELRKKKMDFLRQPVCAIMNHIMSNSLPVGSKSKKAQQIVEKYNLGYYREATEREDPWEWLLYICDYEELSKDKEISVGEVTIKAHLRRLTQIPNKEHPILRRVGKDGEHGNNIYIWGYRTRYKRLTFITADVYKDHLLDYRLYPVKGKDKDETKIKKRKRLGKKK